VDLLRYLVPDHNYLPPGVERAYDRHAGTHAFRFVASTAPPPAAAADQFSFPAASLLAVQHGRRHVTGSACHYFPEEFSLLFTLKMATKRKLQSADVAQCLFAISRRGMKLFIHPVYRVKVKVR